ncbi:PD40 domain-containing protein [Shewanella amazonensis]|nr:PD40 domain-containing protein [Shewanella amazonensis]
MAESPHTRFKLNNFIIDCHNMTIDNGDKSVKLPIKVFDYLKLFLFNENHIVEHEDAINRIWNGNEGVGKRGYINAMWQIRKAFTDLGADCDELFKTLPKVGYVLTVTPEPIPRLAVPAPTRRWPLLVLISLMLLAGLASYSLIQNRKFGPAQEQIEDTMKFPALTSVTNFQGVEEHPAISNDGNMLAFQWLQENRHSGLYIKDLSDSKNPLRLVSSGKYQEALPIWSPDDTALAYVRIDDKNQCQIRVKQLRTQQEKLIDTDCGYVEFKKMLDWSPDGRMLLYPKRINGIFAFFKYDFVTEKTTQVSFPEKNTSDFMGIWLENNQDIVVVREQAQQYKLILLQPSGQEKSLLDYKESITGLTRGKDNNQVFVNFSENGKIATYLLSFNNIDAPELKLINQLSGASGLSFNHKTNELLVAKHQSSEYIVQRRFDSAQIVRRVFSSNRDLYGQFISDPENIVFVSNRSANWDLWRQNEQEARNLTNGIGTVNFASVSPDGKHFATALVKEGDDKQRLYIGNVQDGHLIRVDTGSLTPTFPTWSLDGSLVYFSAIKNNHNGIYQLDIKTSTTTQLTFTDEIYAIPAGNDQLLVSRTNEDGIWRFDINSNQFSQIVTDLSINDFGSFFIQDDELYYLTRTKQSDIIKKYQENDNDAILAIYPADSVRKYFGISKGDSDSFLITLNSIYDADIFSFPVTF